MSQDIECLNVRTAIPDAAFWLSLYVAWQLKEMLILARIRRSSQGVVFPGLFTPIANEQLVSYFRKDEL